MLMNAVPERVIQEFKECNTPSPDLYDFEQANFELAQMNRTQEDVLFSHLEDNNAQLSFETIHPNDTIAQKRILRKRNTDGYGSKIRPKPYDPYEVAWTMNRNARYYQPGVEYIQQRGPLDIQFQNPKFREWITKANDGLTKELNDPVTMAAPYWETYKRPKSEYIGVHDELTDEEHDDLKYERDKAEHKELDRLAREREQKIKDVHGRFDKLQLETLMNLGMLDAHGNILSDEQREILNEERNREERRNLRSMEERTRRRQSEVLPGTSERKLNKLKNSVFEVDETQTAMENNQRLYQVQRDAMMGRPFNKERNYREVTPQEIAEQQRNSSILGVYGLSNYQDYYKMMGMPTMPEYIPGYGYNGMGGVPDRYGLPTTYYDDGARYLNPTKREIRRRVFPTVFVCHNEEEWTKAEEYKKKDYEFRKARKFKKRDILKDGVEYELIWSSTSDEGYTTYEIYDSKLGRYLDMDEVHRRLDKTRLPDQGNMPDGEYVNMVLDCVKQIEKDDTFNLSTELSRYNTYVADVVGYLRDVLDLKAWELLQEECMIQLFQYREIDPLSIFKSTVFNNANHTIVTVPKPAGPGEIKETLETYGDKLSEKCREIYVKNIPFDKMGKDQIAYLKDLYDFEVIPRDKDDLQGLINKMVNRLDEKHQLRLADYCIYKGIFRQKYHLDEVEETFFKWWNSPFETQNKMDEETYENLYVTRMARLAEIRTHQFFASTLTRQQVLERELANHYAWMNQITNGAISRPDLTSQQKMDLICYINSMRDYEELRKTPINIECAPDVTHANYDLYMAPLRYREKESVKYNGLDPAAADIWYNPDDPDDPYSEPVILCPDAKTKERRQKFIDRIFKRVRRPMIS
jgi:hypothetical protein